MSADVRTHFENAPNGWSGDAVDGGLQVLLIAGLIRATDERGTPIETKNLERKAIGKAMFKVESNPPGTVQRIQIRKVMQRLGVQAKQGEELASVPTFLQKSLELAERAGGDAPRPERPGTATLEDIRLAAGNEQLWAIYNCRDELKQGFDVWEDQAKRIETRWPAWNRLQSLLRHAEPLSEAETHLAQTNSILDSRLLLADPDPVMPMVLALAQLLRDELNAYPVHRNRAQGRHGAAGRVVRRARSNDRRALAVRRHVAGLGRRRRAAEYVRGSVGCDRRN